MTFVVGDIHGEISKLQSLINNIKLIDKNPQLIFIGDYINKGENSKEVLEYLIKIDKAIFLMGNHEYYLLEYINNGLYERELIKYSKETTFDDFSTDLKNLIDDVYLAYKSFFDSLLYYYEIGEYFIAHAGIDLKYINEEISKIPKKSFVLNHRYNFIASEVFYENKRIIFGHTGFMYPYVDKYKIGIDTSAVYSKKNPLTAFCIEEEFFINNFNEKRNLENFSYQSCPIIERKKPYRLEK